MRIAHLATVAALLVGAVALAPPAQAQTTALTFTGGSNLTDDPTVGWRFTTTTPITVTSLGFFDDSNDGLVAPHQIAIWNTGGGAPLVTATVPGGVAGTLISGFRFTAATSTVLPAGDYVIGGDKTNGAADAHRSDVLAGDLSLAPGISFVENRYRFDGAGFQLPDSTFAPQEFGYFGPNFRFVVPEPASLALAGLALSGFVLRRGRKA